MALKSSIKNVLCFVLSENQPSTKYRVLQYVDFFRSRDVLLEHRQIAGKTFGEKLRLIRLADTYDVVMVQKKLLSFDLLWYLKKRNPNVCFDFDDALYAKEPYSGRNQGYHPGTLQVRWKLSNTLRRVPCVIAGNRNLAEYARRYNDSVFIVPTPVDTRQYAFVHRDRKKEFNIGWLGTSNNLFYLKRVIPEIIRFLDDSPDAHFYYMSNDDNLGVSHEKVTFEIWSEEGQLAFLQKLSAGLMPLSDDDWSRGKCAFKALQYMSTGLPTIASDVGMNTDVIQDDRNGLLAKGDGDWYLQLQKLQQNRDLYHSISREARKTVEENYSIEHCGSLLLNLFTKISADHED